MILLLPTLILLAGIGQLVLAAASPLIPHVLGWKEDTAKLKLLTRQVFWTYAVYIWVINICFGLVSTFAGHLLLERTPLAGIVSGFMAAYWAGRVLIQFFYFDRSQAPPGLLSKLGEIALTGLFIYLTAVYGCAVYGAVVR
jgi:hypothetical protein